jgi:hypothetical protein
MAGIEKNGFQYYVKRKHVVVRNEEYPAHDLPLNLEEVADEQEKALIDICDTTHVHYLRNVEILLYTEAFHVGRTLIKEGAIADITNQRIMSIAYKTILADGSIEYLGRHEMVHIILGRRWGVCKNDFFLEGMANHLDGVFQGKRIEDIFKSFSVKRPISELLKIRYCVNDYSFYPESGMAIRWMIGKFGLATLKKLYCLGEIIPYPIKILESIVGCSSSELDNAYFMTLSDG